MQYILFIVLSLCIPIIAQTVIGNGFSRAKNLCIG